MTVLATIVVLGVLILVHELGHFWAAKAVGIEVQRFSIGLGPRVFGFTRGETEYVIGWIPLGGYVKMGGMEDEVMERVEGGAPAEPRVPGPRDFDSKSLPARAFVISAGVIMNMLFAFVVYTGIVAVLGIGETAETRVGRVTASALPEGAESLGGLVVGQRITAVGSTAVETWFDFMEQVIEAPAGQITIEASEPQASFRITLTDDEEARRDVLRSVEVYLPALIGPMIPGSPADRGGIEEGDSVLAVAGIAVETWYDFREIIETRAEQRTELTLDRNGTRLIRALVPDEVTEAHRLTGEMVTLGKAGVFSPLSEQVYTRVPFTQAVVYGYDRTVFVSGLILGFLGDLVTGGISPRSVGSIVTIGSASGQAARRGLADFLSFMALFSVNLAILNLLPIPILDGGHLVFLGIEAVRGKALSIEQRLRWSNVGFLVVMGIMVWALSNDILRLFGI